MKVLMNRGKMMMNKTVKRIDPMTFDKGNWTDGAKRKLHSLCLSPMDVKEITQYFHRSEEETLRQIEKTNLFWWCGMPWFVYFCVPGTRELLPAVCPFLLVSPDGKPELC